MLQMNTHFIFPLLTFLISFFHVKSQDVLLRTDGRTYQINLLEKSNKGIRFQKMDERDKRIFSLPNKDVYAIKFADGRIIKNDGSSMSNEMFAYQSVSILNEKNLGLGKALTIACGSVALAGLGMVGAGLYLSEETKKHPYGNPIGELMLMFGGIIITSAVIPGIAIGSVKIHRARKNLRQLGAKPITMNFYPASVPLHHFFCTAGVAGGVGVRLQF